MCHFYAQSKIFVYFFKAYIFIYVFFSVIYPFSFEVSFVLQVYINCKAILL